MEKCKWTYDKHYDVYDTKCGNAHYFAEGDIKENEYLFCPFCGGRIGEDGE